MNYHTYYLYTRALVVLVVAFAWVSVPAAHVQAAVYTWGGQTFTSEEDMQEYMREYIRVRNELYGTSATTPVTTVTKQVVVSQPKPSAVRTVSSSRVSTRSVEEITFSGARLIGTLERTPTRNTKVWFEYGTDWRDLWFATAPERLDQSFGSRTWDRKIENLFHDTTYYYRAVVQESGRTYYGSLKSFRTDVDPQNRDSGVVVTTSGARDVKDNRAILTANISFDRNTTYGKVWFEYGDEKDDLYRKTPMQTITKASGVNNLTYTLRGLDETTVYYFRVVGYDEKGVKNYGVTQSFTTPVDIINEKPKVTTTNATNITPYSAVLGGTVAMNDFRDGVVFIVYGEDRVALQEIPKRYNKYSRIHTDGDNLQKLVIDNNLDREDAFSATATYLDFNTTHYFAIGVEYQDADGLDVILLGNVQSFTTKKLE